MLVVRPIIENQAVSDSGVFTQLISDKQKLHAIILEVTNVGGATAGLALADMISNIKLVRDGTEEIVYGSGPSLHAIAHDCGCPEMGDIYALGAGATQSLSIPLLLGNEFVDPNYYLDLANVNLLQLIVTYAFTIAATGFTTGTAKFSIFGVYEYDAPIDQYKGYIRTRQADSYTATASGNHTTLLPVTTQLSSVHMVSNTYAGDISTPLANILYRGNQGDRVFWNASALHLRQWTAGISPTFPWPTAGTWYQYVPRIASFMHTVDDRNTTDIPKGQYNMLELIQTNQSATGTVVVAYREVVS